jgi:predicted permease
MHPFALIAALRGRLRAIFRRNTVERDLDEEVRFHLEMEIEKNLRSGMSIVDARRGALLAFGGVDRATEAHRDARGTRLAEDAFSDLHYAARSLARAPGFVSVSVFTLAIAIAVGTSLFTAVNGFFYSPLPVPGGRELVSVFTSDFSDREARGGSSYPDLISFSQESSVLAELAGESRITLGIGLDHDVALVPGALVSSGYFRTLRVKPALGQFPTSVRADEPTIVLSHALWRRTFASDASLVGRQVKVNGHFFTVAAVSPPEFLGTTREFAEDFWVDAAFAPLLIPREDVLNSRVNRRFHIIGRLHDDATPAALEARLAIVATRLFQDEPVAWSDTTGRGRRVRVLLERDARLAGVTRGDLLLLVGGVVALGLGLLAVASTNLASMQMARTAARRREIATRLALGASRGRLVRQLLAESALIALPGVIVGLMLATAVSAAVMHYRPPGLPIVDMSLDLRALLFTAGGMLLSLLVFGLMPALQSVRGDLLSDLKGSAQPGRRGIRVGGVRGGLIIVQLALSVMFTAGSGLVAFALARQARDSRADDKRVLVAPVTLLPAAGDSLRAGLLVRDLVESLQRLPGVEAASAAWFVPMPGDRTTTRIEQRDAAGPNIRTVDVNLVRPRYFGVTGLPVLAGRDFDERDMSANARVAIVSSAMAGILWPGDNPVGKQLHVNDVEDPVEIVGVVGELRAEPANSVGAPQGGMMYLPLRPKAESRLVLHLRATGLATAIAAQVAGELRRQNARIVAPEVLPMDRFMDRAAMAARMAARASSILAVLQLALAIAGLSGLVAYVTTLRRREIGIRAALGANAGSILVLVIRQGVRLTAIGGAVGIGMSLALARVIASTLPMSTEIELRALSVAVAGFALVTGAAMLFPARRALAVTPATALRVD